MSILFAILSMPGLLGLYVIWHIARDWLRKDEGEIAPLPSEVPVGKRRSRP